MRHPLFSMVLAISLGTATTPVRAQHHHGMRHFDHHQHRVGGNWGWVAPAVIGGAVVYGLTHSAPVVVQQQPVYIQQPPTVIIDGVVYVKQIMVVNGVAQEVLVRQ